MPPKRFEMFIMSLNRWALNQIPQHCLATLPEWPGNWARPKLSVRVGWHTHRPTRVPPVEGLGVSSLPPEFPPLQVSALWRARLYKNSRRNNSFLASVENIVLMFILPFTLVAYINYAEKIAVSSNRQWAHLSCSFLKWYHKNKSTPSKIAYKE